MEGIDTRPFVPEEDDATLVSVSNAAWAGTPGFVTLTLEQIRIARRAPGRINEGSFLAERDSIPVGIVGGHVDAQRAEPLAFLAGPSVLPEHRRSGVGTALARRAFDFLRARGMARVRAATGNWNSAGNAFLEKLGFTPIRHYSLMRRPLAGLPSGIGEDSASEISLLGTSPEEVSLLVRLSNEAFREHFGHRDGTTEENAFWSDNAAAMGVVLRRTVARIGGEAVGFLVCGIDRRVSEELAVRRGGLWSVGVLKACRRKGVAKRLMLEGMEWLAGQGLDEVELGVDDDNVSQARRLYERLGFSVVSGDTTWEKTLV